MSTPQAAPLDVRALLGRHPVVDGHNDLPWQAALRYGGNVERMGLQQGNPDLHTDIPRLREGCVGAQFWSA